jgi:hypothetical protein
VVQREGSHSTKLEAVCLAGTLAAPKGEAVRRTSGTDGRTERPQSGSAEVACRKSSACGRSGAAMRAEVDPRGWKPEAHGLEREAYLESSRLTGRIGGAR